MKLCEMLGWLSNESLCLAGAASDEVLARFHDPEYINALKEADSSGKVSREVRERYHFGTMENPLFPGLFQRAATTVGGSILAAEQAMAGFLTYHPAGGTHHGRPGRACGFCYFNDPVFALLTFLQHGLQRVLYVDLDAHHGDGVQEAFASDERVMTISIHEANRWPYSGLRDDRGMGFARNFPVPRGFNDSEMDFLMREAVLPLANGFEPEALVITCGADGLAGDPLSGMELSNEALWNSVISLVRICPRAVVLGGGGYNPWTTARCWTGLWGLLSGRTLPDKLPSSCKAFLQSFECDLVDEEDRENAWLTRLQDDPGQTKVRPELVELLADVMQ
jgi:acetoin utilization protein AcuC